MAEGNAITVYNGAGFDLKFRVKWNGGNTDWTDGYPAGQGQTMYLAQQSTHPPEGADMWPEIQALVLGTYKKECSPCTYVRENDTKVHYSVSGGFANITCSQD